MITLSTESRTQLKSYFEEYQTPTEDQFSKLIQGMLNQTDDGVAKISGQPLSILADGQPDPSGQTPVLALYQDFASTQPDWVFKIGNAQGGGSLNLEDDQGQSRLFIDGQNGRIGIGHTQPQEALDVNGGLKLRQGGITFPDGSVQLSTLKIQSGSVYTNDQKLQKGPNGERWVDMNVAIQGFQSPPTIFVALQSMDAEQHNNLRVYANVDSNTVKKDKFTIRFGTWSDTKIYMVRASWLAFGY